MRKLYWYPLEEGSIEDKKDCPRIYGDVELLKKFEVIGGLGVTPIKMEYCCEKGDGLRHPTSYAHGSRFTPKCIGYVKGFDSSNADNKYSCLTLGDGKKMCNKFLEDYFGFCEDMSKAQVFQFLEKNLARYVTEPVKVLPFVNGKIDSRFWKWELFEEGGFIYGKRNGKIYDLVRREIKFRKPFAMQDSSVVAYTIGDTDNSFGEEGSFSAFHETDKLTSTSPIWVDNFNDKYSQFRLNLIDRYTAWEMEVTVERLREL